jgi:adenylate kinase family enzyme
MSSTQAELDQYLNRKYKGKPWRRLTTDEIKGLGDKALLEQLDALEKLEKQKAEKKAKIQRMADGEEEPYDPSVWTPNEVKPDEERSFYGPNGDIPDNITNEQMDEFIASERQRIYRNVITPPRSEKYLDIFKNKYPDIPVEKIKKGFFTVKDGKETAEGAMVRKNQAKRHVRVRRLTVEEQAEREIKYGKEDKTVVAYASIEQTKMIQDHVYGNSDGVDVESLKMPAPGRDAAGVFARRPPIDVIPEGTPDDKELFEPEEDLLHPITYQEMPVTDLIKEQQDKLKINELERGIPPQVSNDKKD